MLMLVLVLLVARGLRLMLVLVGLLFLVALRLRLRFRLRFRLRLRLADVVYDELVCGSGRTPNQDSFCYRWELWTPLHKRGSDGTGPPYASTPERFRAGRSEGTARRSR